MGALRSTALLPSPRPRNSFAPDRPPQRRSQAPSRSSGASSSCTFLMSGACSAQRHIREEQGGRGRGREYEHAHERKQQRDVHGRHLMACLL